MKTAMRAQREKVQLLKDGKADADDVMIARAKYQGQLDEYARFSKDMGLKQQRERIYYDMRGRVAPSKDKKLFTISTNNAIIKSSKMYRKKKDAKAVEPMPKKQLQRILKAFKRNGGIIQMDELTDRYLLKKNAEAITYDAKTILLKRNLGRAAVFEKLIYATQFIEGKNDGTYLSRILCEIKAQEKLLKYSDAYKLTKVEIDQTKKALISYQKEYEKLIG